MFRELELTWDGKTKRVKPTLDMLRYLEDKKLGPYDMAVRLSRNTPDIATFACFVGAVLRYAGFDVNDDDVMGKQSTPGEAAQLRLIVMNIVHSMIPQQEVTPAKKPTPRKPRTLQKTT